MFDDPRKQPTSALVAALREAGFFTQEELARELGVAFSTVNAWEAGRSEPQTRHRRRILELASRVFGDGDTTSILVVDDDEIDRRATEAVITDASDALDLDVVVVGESDPVRALMQLGRLRPALALLDVYMPGLDGFELADQVREMDGMGATRVAFITAGRDDRLAQQAWDRGLQLVPKPLSARDAGALVRDAIAPSRGRHGA